MSSGRTTVPWVEKYRPKKIDDVVHRGEVINSLKSMLMSENLPHLLFYGPAGTGKTSTILAAAKQLFGPEYFFSRVLELNASDERGINVVRSKIKDFAQIAVGKRPTDSKYPIPPYKIIILDEADAMTRDAQAALRRIMEEYSKVTRFCIICNYVSGIIEPVASRCAKFRFQPLDEENMIERLSHIAREENLSVKEETLRYICKVSGGDMRKAITTLQSASTMFPEVTVEAIAEISGFVPEKYIQDLFDACLVKKDLREMVSLVDTILSEAFPASQVIEQLHDLIISSDSLEDIHKAKICLYLANVEKRLRDGADESLQLKDLGAFMIRTKDDIKGEDDMVDV